MNHIAKLTAIASARRVQLDNAADELTELMAYLSRDKFSWPDNDYVHIRTDLMPRLSALRSILTGEG